MDRNQIIGFSLLAALLITYVVYNNYSETKYQEAKLADSIAYAKAHPLPKVDSSKLQTTKVVSDTLSDSARSTMPPALHGNAETITLENGKLALSFTTKGAFPTAALLKEYKTYNQQPLYLFNGKENMLSLSLPMNNGAMATSDLYFTHQLNKQSNGDQALVFTSDLGEGKSVTISYTLPANDYMMRTSIHTTGMTATESKLHWQTQSLHTERDLSAERMNSQIYYQYNDGDKDYYTIKEGNEQKTLDKKAKWVGYRMHFFSTALIADNGFNSADVRTTDKLDSNYVSQNKTTFKLSADNTQTIHLKWYIGPNSYKTLSSYNLGLDEMVPLGYGVMAFVKYINKWLIIPIFDTLSKFISNFGVIIMLMTIIIRLLLSFFTYKSYLSSAKMRVLKPELDELRTKFGDDQQKFGMEQMKLYRTAGVNPLGGCLPTLLQLPILFAMYYFFPSSIELRQEKFLWATDLSTYDSILSWQTHIPVVSSVFGNHLSLFTILMTASSLFLALYNKNMTPQDPNNPMMKWLPYIFPFMLIGVFNKMAAALTFYYFFSNMISIAQQFVIQKLFINEQKIHAQIQEKKNKPATPSKWQEKIEQMQKAQQEKMKQPKKK
ncbi:MAG TPA: membrane protein insertase YidC [Flavipsychrobacter sp.]|nr:membrane protein insertase YidC [Flavipsychrobacter sp.]